MQKKPDKLLKSGTPKSLLEPHWLGISFPVGWTAAPSRQGLLSRVRASKDRTGRSSSRHRTRLRLLHPRRTLTPTPARPGSREVPVGPWAPTFPPCADPESGRPGGPNLPDLGPALQPSRSGTQAPAQARTLSRICKEGVSRRLLSTPPCRVYWERGVGARMRTGCKPLVGRGPNQLRSQRAGGTTRVSCACALSPRLCILAWKTRAGRGRADAGREAPRTRILRRVLLRRRRAGRRCAHAHWEEGRALAGVWAGRRRAMGLLALLLIALCAAGVRGLYFHIGETEKRCFIEEIPDETMVIGQAGRGWTGPCVSSRRGRAPTS